MKEVRESKMKGKRLFSAEGRGQWRAKEGQNKQIVSKTGAILFLLPEIK